MSVSGSTPPRVGEPPSTGDTSSGSLHAKQPETKKHAVASCSASVATSSAELVAQLRGGENDLATPVPGSPEQVENIAEEDTGSADKVRTDSSEDDYHPRPREETLSGLNLIDFLEKQRL